MLGRRVDATTFTALDVLQKAVSVFITVFIIMSVIFATFMVMLGDASLYMVPRAASVDLSERIVEEMRLDEPLFVQFTDYLVDTLTGDFRVSASFEPGYDIQDFIWDYVGNTVVLLSIGLLASLAIAAALEMFVSGRARKGPSIIVHAVSLLFLSIPAFCLALLVFCLNVELNLVFPPYGHGTATQPVSEQMILPALTVVLSSTGFAVILMREGVRTSRSDGGGDMTGLRSLAEGMVALRPLMHFYVAWTMSIVIAVDMVFYYGGLGQLLFDSLVRLDYPTLMAALFMSSMVVLAAGIIVSVAVHAVARSKVDGLLSDWGRRVQREPRTASTAARERTSWQSWLASLRRGYRASAAGLTAAVILVIFVVLGVFAPLLSTVPDPMDMDNAEPSFPPDWRNPLPPSLNPSPYTDLLHPLGTDIRGMDVYSMWLYSARDAVGTAAALLIGSVAIGLIVGMVAASTAFVTGFPARTLDFFLTTGARAAVAMPITAFIAVRMMAFDTREMVLAIPMLLVAFYAWAWMLVLRPVRKAFMSASGQVSMSWMTPQILAETLSVAKFAVPLLLIAYFSIYTTGFRIPYDLSWGGMIYDAYSYSAFSQGQWFLVVPPIVGMSLIVISLFVALDRAEVVVRRSASYPSSDL